MKKCVWIAAQSEGRTDSEVQAPPLAARPATALMILTPDLGLSIHVSMFEYVRLVHGNSSAIS